MKVRCMMSKGSTWLSSGALLLWFALSGCAADEGCLDRDGDGYPFGNACDTSLGQSESLECDQDSRRYPNATELCDGLDNDCDQAIDEDTTQMWVWYPDADGDGVGDLTGPVSSCTTPAGHVSSTGDCDDANPHIYPGTYEQCNGIDDDCDGMKDDDVSPVLWYPDRDGDGFGTESGTQISCDRPMGFVPVGGDCDDDDPGIFPGATERCNQLDDDCDGRVDEEVEKIALYRDQDGDGWGGFEAIESCPTPGYVISGGDCDDANPGVSPGAEERCNGQDDDCDGLSDEGFSATRSYRDGDLDGYGDPLYTYDGCSRPYGYVGSGTDCNDSNASIHPNALETCNGTDDNCDGAIDDGLALAVLYTDTDGDGYGVSATQRIACMPVVGVSSIGGDCDDQDPLTFPGALEVCNGRDDDCDAAVDELVTRTWFVDADGDRHGDLLHPIEACAVPGGYVASSGDCDDADPAVYPGAGERCNTLDDNCDGKADEGLPVATYYPDSDGDGYGPTVLGVVACANPGGYVLNLGDCNELRSDINPAAPELCDGIDQDCDGLIDDGLAFTLYYADRDGDGFGVTSQLMSACIRPSGYALQPGDCNDSDTAVFPGAIERCNTADDDCDGLEDEGLTFSSWYRDTDGDGYGGATLVSACSQPSGYASRSGDCNDANASIHPGSSELCNGLDDNCDGLSDEGLASGTLYLDSDGDGFGSAARLACFGTAGTSPVGGDCNDQSRAIYPGASEQCNVADDDCDGLVDEDVETPWYYDGDADGWGSADVVSLACSAPGPDWSTRSGDCDDSDAAVYPGATDGQDALDNDCDGLIDEDTADRLSFEYIQSLRRSPQEELQHLYFACSPCDTAPPVVLVSSADPNGAEPLEIVTRSMAAAQLHLEVYVPAGADLGFYDLEWEDGTGQRQVLQQAVHLERGFVEIISSSQTIFRIGSDTGFELTLGGWNFDTDGSGPQVRLFLNEANQVACVPIESWAPDVIRCEVANTSTLKIEGDYQIQVHDHDAAAFDCSSVWQDCQALITGRE